MIKNKMTDGGRHRNNNGLAGELIPRQVLLLRHDFSGTSGYGKKNHSATYHTDRKAGRFYHSFTVCQIEKPAGTVVVREWTDVEY